MIKMVFYQISHFSNFSDNHIIFNFYSLKKFNVECSSIVIWHE